MARVAMGLRARTGSAVAVVLAGAPGAPQLLDRRRIELLAPGLPHGEVYHLARRRSGDAERFIAQATKGSAEQAGVALGALLGDLMGHEVVAAGIVLGQGRAPASVAQGDADPRGHARRGR